MRQGVGVGMSFASGSQQKIDNVGTLANSTPRNGVVRRRIADATLVHPIHLPLVGAFASASRIAGSVAIHFGMASLLHSC